MTRMSKEFSLVLLGAGMLTAAYLLWPEPDPEAKANEQAQQRAGGSTTGRVHGFIWISAMGRGPSPTRAGASSSPGSYARGASGGFGSTAARAGGGGSS